MAITSRLELADFAMIAGDHKIQEFTCVDEDNITPIVLAGSTVEVRYSPWGDKQYKILTKTGIIFDVNKWNVTLENEDTVNWEAGYYAFQPIVTDEFGKEFKMAQGRLWIMESI